MIITSSCLLNTVKASFTVHKAVHVYLLPHWDMKHPNISKWSEDLKRNVSFLFSKLMVNNMAYASVKYRHSHVLHPSCVLEKSRLFSSTYFSRCSPSLCCPSHILKLVPLSLPQDITPELFPLSPQSLPSHCLKSGSWWSRVHVFLVLTS